MGSLTILLSAVVAVSFMVAHSEAAGSCPLPSKTYSCSPKCVQNYECSHGRLCCPNSCNAKSCVEPSGNSDSRGDKYSSTSGAGVYCNNVKCNSFEVCKQDAATKRNKCQRP